MTMRRRPDKFVIYTWLEKSRNTSPCCSRSGWVAPKPGPPDTSGQRDVELEDVVFVDNFADETRQEVEVSTRAIEGRRRPRRERERRQNVACQQRPNQNFFVELVTTFRRRRR